ncbi:MAG: substrate-binding domain-containing protein [Humidesulfovibrio sp.]|nr:substrate-binding domain-containing protein [Humidesulfovibrio sp.]
MRKRSLNKTPALALLLAFALAATAFAATAFAAEDIKIGTTTSTADTGLLDYLEPMVLKDTGLQMRWIAVGTGKALEHGKNCDVDVLMVHAPGAEKKFIAEGNGVSRAEFMYNDFVLVGPVKDPARIKGKGVADSLKAIAGVKAPFASRGDDSGTHKMEKDLWKVASMPIPDKESWYIGVGQGMLATLRIAAERGAYTLTDRGTWIKYEAKDQGNSGLAILSEGDKALLNQYSIVQLAPKCDKIKHAAAKKLQNWFVSTVGQKAIAGFMLEGKQLFFPNAAK